MAEKEFFGPLTLQQANEILTFNLDEQHKCLCVLCDNEYVLPEDKQSFLMHLFTKHKLVISDVNDIADLKEYLRYWRLRFKDEGLPFFCTTILLEGKPDGSEAKNNEHYLLSDVLPEDKELRLNLQQARLEKLLKHHQFEREDKNFEKECLFCRHTSKDTRATYLKHLYEKHNFHIAKPENLIFINDLIRYIEVKLEKLQCIYCEKYFKNRVILKEHMRKKGHKRINPGNKEYDKYFLVNYLGEKEPERHKMKQHYKPKVSDNKKTESNEDSDPEWSDWTEEDGPLITCLLCEHGETDYEEILKHMEKQHEFSFKNETKELDFYHKIKIVNFIRLQIHLKQCINCNTKFTEKQNLVKHMKESKHYTLNKEKWDQPEYYFPTYEDDLFLCFINDEDESWWSTDEKEAESCHGLSDISKKMALSVLSDDM